MALVLETSALLRRYLGDRDRPVVMNAMATADTWVGSALSRTEVLMALRQTATTPTALDQTWALARRDWDAMWEVPVDHRCLASAAELGTQFGITIVDAIQLAAALRIPSPVQFCTFVPSQYAAAEALGFELITA